MKIVVIGAGMGGMTAAARLARSGHSVTLYEASDTYGGKLRTEWIGKFAFDTGPSLLTLPAVYKDFFIRTGKPLGQLCEIKAVDPSFDYRFADGTSLTFANLSRHHTLNGIRNAYGEDVSRQWEQMMKRATKMWDVSREPFIESELRSPFSLLKRTTLIRDIFTIAPWKSLRDFANEQLPDQRLRYILDRYATYSGSDPRKAPAVLATIAYVEEAFGAWHIKGGLGTLAQLVYQRCIDVGVEFHFNSSVAEITVEKAVAQGVRLSDGTIVRADAVIANADAALIYNQLIKGEKRKLRKVRKNLKRAGASIAGFTLLLGLRKDGSAPLNHHTILFPQDYDAEFDSIFEAKLPVQNPTIYICAPNDEQMVKDASLESWSVLVNAPHHGIDGFDWSDENFARIYANSIIDQIEARGISVRDRLESLTIRTPADLERTVLAPGGSIYGTSSNGARAAFMRAKNRSPIKGLYCVGGSAHPGGGLPLVG
ncbi:MAG: phytoene desaturase, partial [Actinobacteria bacterium]|nr:phytoene desaturase [Actinomycetota bacterium]MSX58297.1 phytoene desaturase [Actinomycetota bacterium]